MNAPLPTPQVFQDIPTGILRYGSKGEQLPIKNNIEKLIIVVLDTKEHTITQPANKTWIIKICHAVFMQDVTDAFRQINCDEVVFNFGKTAVEYEYKFNLLKHLPKNVQKITIMNCMSYFMTKFDEYENIKSLKLVNCPYIREIYNNVLQTDIEEVIIQDGAKLNDERSFSNSKIMLYYRESEIGVATPKVENHVQTKTHHKTGLSPTLPPITTNSVQSTRNSPYVTNSPYVQNYWSLFEQRNRQTKQVNEVCNPYANEFW